MPSMLSYPRRLKSGHITCYLNRTYHVLTTAESCTLSSLRECATLPAARGLATERLTPRAMHGKEIVMRLFRFLMVLIVSLAVLIVTASLSRAQTVTYPYSFTGQGGPANPFYGTLTQGRNANLYGTAYELSGGGGAVSSFFIKCTRGK